MSKVIVDSEDLLALVRACEEYELDARAHRATWTTLRLTVDIARLDLRYGEVYRSERDQYATTAKRKYEPISQAIADGTPADLALKQVADRLRR
jgi:hypothetical protein